MTDTTNTTDELAALTGPTPNEIETGLTTFSATARENVFQAINILNDAESAGDIANAILHLENTQGQIEVLEQAIPMIVTAAQTLQKVAFALRDQRDEAVEQRDEAVQGEQKAKRFAHAAFDEGLSHIWECSDCYSAVWEQIMEGFPEDIMNQVNEIEGYLSPEQIAPLKQSAETLEKALEAYFTEKRKAEKLIDEADKPEHKYIIRDAKTGETMEIDPGMANPHDLLLDTINDDGFYDDDEDIDDDEQAED